MAVLTNTMLQGSSAVEEAASDYQIEKSLRLSDGGNFQARFGLGNIRIWTWSGWIKRVKLGSIQTIFGAPGHGNTSDLRFNATDQLVFRDGASNYRVTTAKYRDTSAWYHVVFQHDTTESTAAERVKIYVNGVQQATTDQNYGENSSSDFNTNAKHEYARSDSVTGDLYLSDVFFIDGQSLSCAAFGSFDSLGVWNPKDAYNSDGKFAPPAPNDGTTWSSGVTSETGSYYAGNDAAQLFDGNTSGAGNSVDASAQAKWVKWTPSGGKEFTTSVRIHHGGSANDYTLKLDDGRIIGPIRANTNAWTTLYEGKGTIEYIQNDPVGSVYNNWGSVEVDGVVLRDGRTDPSYTRNLNHNNWASPGTVWSSYVTGTAYTNQGGDKAFDGRTDTLSQASNPGNASLTWKPPAAITGKVEILIAAGDHGGAVSGEFDLKIGNVSKFDNSIWPDNTTGWVDLGTQTIDTTHGLVWGNGAGGNWHGIKMLKIDGVPLVDNTHDNSHHLTFNDTTTNASLGRDCFRKLSNETVGLPIYNTDESGGIKGVGYRTDPHASNLQLAIPGDSLASGTCDVHQQINTSSSNRAVTNNGAVVKTDAAGNYNAALWFDGVDDYITFPNDADICDMGNGNFTWECWIKPTPEQTFASVILMGFYNSASAGQKGPYLYLSGMQPRFGWMNSDGDTDWIELGNNVKCDHRRWSHVAVVRDGTKITLYLNGDRHDGTEDGNPKDVGTDTQRTESGAFNVGGSAAATGHKYRGYIQDIRVYKGVAKYTAPFIPPYRNDFRDMGVYCDDGTVTASDAVAAPIYNTTGSPDYGATKGSGTRADPWKNNLVLAIPFSDSGDSDSTTWKDHSADIKGSGSNKSVTRTGSSIVYSTTKSYLYGASTSFSSGAGNSINIPYSSDFDFSGDHGFTIEGWIYHTANVSGGAAIWSQGTSGGFQLNINVIEHGGFPGYCLNVECPGGRTRSNEALPLNEWVHFAAVSRYDYKDDSSYGFRKYLFINGVEQEINTNDSIGTSDTVYIGRMAHDAGAYGWAGYMQDIRVYDHCKYNHNFTVPKAPDAPIQDSVIDSPTSYLPTGGNDALGGVTRGNYCTWNPLHKDPDVDLSQGNLKHTQDADGTVHGTLGASSGKWYFEMLLEAGTSPMVGVSKMSNAIASNVGGTDSYAVMNDGRLFQPSGDGGTESSAFPTWTNGDYIGVALDMDNGKLFFSKNGTFEHAGSSSDPANGTNPVNDVTLTGTWGPCIGNGPAMTATTNFGQRAFKYAAPSGFKCLCNQNLDDTFTGTDLNNPSKYFDILTYTGTGTTSQDVLGLGFQPDLVWIKNRGAVGTHNLFDAVRGNTKRIFSDLNQAENTNANIFDFKATGIEVTEDSGVTADTNDEDATYVAWAWDTGTAAASTSNSGSATNYTRWTNATAGFSVIKATISTGSGYHQKTVDHGLGVPPEFIIGKGLDAAEDWLVYHSSIGTAGVLNLNDTGASDTSTSWKYTATSNSQFTFDSYGAAQNMIYYVWAPIAGYSSFGKYTGNNSDAGPFVYTGFQPSLVIVKTTDTTGNWVMYDNARGPTNPNPYVLLADTNGGGSTHDAWVGSYPIDMLSNGFKIRGNTGEMNGTNTFIYMAWAESPFKTARGN